MTETEKQLNAVQALVDSPGWLILRDWAEAQKKLAFDLMTKSTDSHAMAKNLGRYQSLAEVLDWPKVKLGVLKDVVRAEQEGFPFGLNPR